MIDSANKQEQQRAPRVPVNLQVQVVDDDDSKTAAGKAMLVNIARGGIFIETTESARIGGLVHLQFRMLKARVCHAVGTVVWQRPAASGFGVAFVETNSNMDTFVRNISALPEKLRQIYLADVLDPRIELNVNCAEASCAQHANEVA